MRFMQIAGGFILSVNNNEQELIKILEKKDIVWQSELNSFAINLAEKMVSKGLLIRVEQDNIIGYRPNLGDSDD